MLSHAYFEGARRVESFLVMWPIRLESIIHHISLARHDHHLNKTFELVNQCSAAHHIVVELSLQIKMLIMHITRVGVCVNASVASYILPSSYATLANGGGKNSSLRWAASARCKSFFYWLEGDDFSIERGVGKIVFQRARIQTAHCGLFIRL